MGSPAAVKLIPNIIKKIPGEAVGRSMPNPPLNVIHETDNG
jgi:hypothetical protein